MVSGSISLPCSGCFSPFPHGTSSLSVSQEYLALPDGPGRFTQGFTCPVLLRVLLGSRSLRVRGYHPILPFFPERSTSDHFSTSQPYNPTIAETIVVWAIPRSLATTYGITIVFFSSGYLDVSVLRVCFLFRMIYLQYTGFPHSEIYGSRVICTSP